MFYRKQPETAPKQSATGANTGYMAELEAWLDSAIFEPITSAIATQDAKELHIAVTEAKQLLKRKVLASYHNGLKAQSSAIKPQSHERSTFRRN